MNRMSSVLVSATCIARVWTGAQGGTYMAEQLWNGMEESLLHPVPPVGRHDMCCVFIMSVPHYYWGVGKQVFFSRAFHNCRSESRSIHCLLLSDHLRLLENDTFQDVISSMSTFAGCCLQVRNQPHVQLYRPPAHLGKVLEYDPPTSIKESLSTRPAS